jgi:hypothetical protein
MNLSHSLKTVMLICFIVSGLSLNEILTILCLINTVIWLQSLPKSYNLEDKFFFLMFMCFPHDHMAMLDIMQYSSLNLSPHTNVHRIAIVLPIAVALNFWHSKLFRFTRDLGNKTKYLQLWLNMNANENIE